MKKLLSLVAGFLLLVTKASAYPQLPDAFFRALREVETGDGSHLIGDGGKALGPYQIHRAYWQDAIKFDPSIGGQYHDCLHEKYSRRIVTAYLSRYESQSVRRHDFYWLALFHHAGPSLMPSPGALDYARRVNDLSKKFLELRY